MEGFLCYEFGGAGGLYMEGLIYGSFSTGFCRILAVSKAHLLEF